MSADHPVSTRRKPENSSSANALLLSCSPLVLVLPTSLGGGVGGLGKIGGSKKTKTNNREEEGRRALTFQRQPRTGSALSLSPLEEGGRCRHNLHAKGKVGVFSGTPAAHYTDTGGFCGETTKLLRDARPPLHRHMVLEDAELVVWSRARGSLLLWVGCAT